MVLGFYNPEQCKVALERISEFVKKHNDNVRYVFLPPNEKLSDPSGSKGYLAALVDDKPGKTLTFEKIQASANEYIAGSMAGI